MNDLREVLRNSYVLRCKIRNEITGKFSDKEYRLFRDDDRTGKWWLPEEDALQAGVDLRGRKEDTEMIEVFLGNYKKVIELPVTLQIDSLITTEYIMVIFGNLLKEKGYSIYQDLISSGKVTEKEEQIVAIEVDSGAYFVCSDRKEAFKWNDENHPGKLLYLHIISPQQYYMLKRLKRRGGE